MSEERKSHQDPVLKAYTPLVAALAVLGVLWLVLPMALPAAGAERSLADCLTMADRPSTDLSSLKRCYDLVPEDVELAADLARAYESAGRADDAIAVYRKIITLDPTYADARVRLAHLLRAKGDEAGAREQVDAALQVQPGRPSLLSFARELSE